jgi:peptidoglycan/LPS O-acetylase OafA/YrhL
MNSFKGIEGARAWLAWTVVISHIWVWGGLSAISLGRAGHYAVEVFIVISGFVITNLIIEKHEPYPIYIARRFLRIYPVYVVCLTLGILATPLGIDALLHYPLSRPHVVEHFSKELAGYREQLWPHVLLHLTMFHGATPNTILQEAQYIFLPPAWSLSLEWQFYLVAPAAVWAAQRRGWNIALAVVALIGVWTFRREMFGHFYKPSFLPGAGILFLIGIGTRLAIDKLPELRSYPTLAILIVFGITITQRDLLPIAIWVAMVAYILQPRKWAMLDGRIALWAGARSYSVYLVHYPIMLLTMWVAVKVLGLSGWETLLVSGSATILLTIAAAELIYWLVEKPVIGFGKTLGRPSRSLQPTGP